MCLTATRQVGRKDVLSQKQTSFFVAMDDLVVRIYEDDLIAEKEM